MKRSDEYSQFELKGKERSVSLLTPAVLLVSVACVVGIVYIAVSARDAGWFAYLVLFSLAGLGLATYSSLRSAAQSWERVDMMAALSQRHVQAMEDQRRAIEEQTRSLLEQGKAVEEMLQRIEAVEEPPESQARSRS